jgi:hypothetical protein
LRGEGGPASLPVMPPASPLKVESSRAYENFIAERQQILDYKWIESQKAGEDIGLERALTEWVSKHRAAWREAMRTQLA